MHSPAILAAAATAAALFIASSAEAANLISKSGFCLDVPSNNQAPGQLLHLFQCNNKADSMFWNFNPDGTITSTNGLCLDNVDAKNVNGNGIQLQKCNGNPAQKWQPLGSGAIANVGTSGARCLNLNNNNLANNERVQLWDCNNADGSVKGGSQWTIGEPLPDAGTTTFIAYHPNGGFALDNPFNGGRGTQVDLFDSARAANVWTFNPDGTIRTPRGFCLDNTNGQLVDGNPVQVFDCNGTPAQKWIYRSDRTIFNLQSQRCLDNDSGRQQNGNKVQMWTCQNGNPSQTWDRPAVA
ncbi:ricin B lectin domain-containing protein [Zopfochytrium polystomum]|nr:ricin B lectin domain-containing protein [Zopfochytrium polystomum]